MQNDPPQVDASQSSRWALPARIAFRFCFIYFGLFCVFTQILSGLLPVPGVDLPDLGTLWPMNRIVSWTAVQIFRLSRPQYLPTGSVELFDRNQFLLVNHGFRWIQEFPFNR